ncbi:MAG: hypothetical protein OJF55_002278 [Rhodanobacteraceae bacterium]|nr:MAG: hypothetical protein OJF55_002278 [Rhodanobacteraceae bacterium]
MSSFRAPRSDDPESVHGSSRAVAPIPGSLAGDAVEGPGMTMRMMGFR